MADIQIPIEAKTKSLHRKSLSTRVDLTPMVDLGFLLITFFIFTTATSKPNGMKLFLPDEGQTNKPTLAAESKVLTLLLTDSLVIYYNGSSSNRYSTTDYSTKGLRALILEKKKQVASIWKKENETVILIKPSQKSTYKNIVAVLDEMQLNNIKKFVLMEPLQSELAIIK